jgi:similar to spore coat protein
MNSIVKYITGTDAMTDQVIATDLLLSAKTGIQNYAVALTETASPEIKAVLRKHLDEAVAAHEQITAYMVQNGFYHPYDIREQARIDIKNAETSINIP